MTHGARQSDPETEEPQNRRNGSDRCLPGGEPMTAAQATYLQMLSEEAQEAFDPRLTSAEASRLIEALEERTGRGPIRLRPVI